MNIRLICFKPQPIELCCCDTVIENVELNSDIGASAQ